MNWNGMVAGGSIDERQPTQPSRRKTGTLALAIRRGRWSDAPPDGTPSSAGRPAAASLQHRPARRALFTRGRRIVVIP
jgi:hypothetical protein